MLQEVIDSIKPFIDCKETNEYMNIVSKNYLGKGEEHHILPESIYPEYSKCAWNIVNLKYEDHYRVHELLPFMLSGKNKGSMLYAWNLMCGRTNGEFVDSSKYAELRKLHSIRVSEQMRQYQPMRDPKVVNKLIGRKYPEHSIRMSGDNNPTKREEVRKLISDNNPMKLEENKQKFRGSNNANYGKEISEEHKEILRNFRLGTTMEKETKEKISKSLKEAASKSKIKIDETEYSSVIEAAKAYGVDRHTIKRWVKSGKAEKLTSQQVCLIIDGVKYSSMSQAAHSLNVSRATIRSYIKHGKAKLLDKTNLTMENTILNKGEIK